MKKVAKFGGSSLASAEQFKKVGEIIHADQDRKYIVPSAPGKRFADDTKVTDLLYACYHTAEDGEDIKLILEEIRDRYQEIIDGLELDLSLEQEFAVIGKNIREHAGADYAASRGEYLNGLVMAAYLGFTFIDAAEVIFFDESGEFDADKTHKILSARLAEGLLAAFVKYFNQGQAEAAALLVPGAHALKLACPAHALAPELLRLHGQIGADSTNHCGFTSQSFTRFCVYYLREEKSYTL